VVTHDEPTLTRIAKEILRVYARRNRGLVPW